MNKPNYDWVAYKVHFARSVLEENLKEHQIINNGRIKTQQENLKNMHRELDTGKRLVTDRKRIPKKHAEENFTCKLLTFGDDTERKKMHSVIRKPSFEEVSNSNIIVKNEHNVKNHVHDKFENRPMNKTQENKQTSLDEIERPIPIVKQKQLFCKS